MNPFVLRVASVFALALFTPSIGLAADTNPPPRLTVELRDGSRVVGESVDKNLKLRSALLGDFKLSVKAVRSVEFTKTNAAKLATVNGDSLTVAFLDANIPVKTSFGQVNLATDSIRKLSVAVTIPTGPQRNGLVALWSGEGDGKDSVGLNHGKPINVAFATGKVGQSFDFNGTDAYVEIPDSDTWAFGKNDFTILLWANFRSQPVYDMGHSQGGVFISNDEGPNNVSKWWFALGGGVVNFHINNPELGPGWLVRAPFRPNLNQWYHMAITRNGNHYATYVNGVMVGTESNARAIPHAGAPLMIGQAEGFYFNGRLDEIAIYNRALSSEEIKSTCIQDNQGEPLPLPATINMPFKGIRQGYWE
jgi:hypothetical protein